MKCEFLDLTGIEVLVGKLRNADEETIKFVVSEFRRMENIIKQYEDRLESFYEQSSKSNLNKISK